jgi:hypothetical protein
VEAEPVKPDDPPVGWPLLGNITFDDVALKYRPELPPVLKGLSFAVRAGEKVSILNNVFSGTILKQLCPWDRLGSWEGLVQENLRVFKRCLDWSSWTVVEF